MKRVKAIITLFLIPFALGATPPLPTQHSSMPTALNLEQALLYALENNFAIQLAQKDIAQQSGVIVEIKAKTRPSVDLSYEYKEQDSSLSDNFFSASSSIALVLSARQSLYAGGGSKAALSKERFNKEAATFQLQVVINEQLLAVRNQFYRLLLNQEQIKVQQALLDLRQEQRQNIDDRYQAGSISRFELLQAQVSLANAKPPLIRAQNTYRVGLEELRELLGYTHNDLHQNSKTPQLVGALDYPQAEVDLWQSLQSARTQRPELLRLDALSSASKHALRQAKAPYYPNLALVANYQLLSASEGDSWDDTVNGWVLGLEGSWSIFDSKETQGLVIQRKAEMAKAQLNYEQLALGIDVEVRRAYSDLQEAKELVEASRQVVEQAAEAIRLAQSRFDVGTATQLDLLQAQVDLTEARTNKIEALYAYNTALASLRKAEGFPDPAIALSPF